MSVFFLWYSTVHRLQKLNNMTFLNSTPVFYVPIAIVAGLNCTVKGFGGGGKSVLSDSELSGKIFSFDR